MARIAVVGGGWAGMAAAVHATRAGHAVTVLEAAPVPGGRARAIELARAAQAPLTLDNGQHILIGAYTHTLALMREVGVDPDLALLRQPLALRFPDGQGLALPDAPAPLDALVGIARARGWSWRDKLALLRTAARWQRQGFRCDAGQSVASMCRSLPRAVREGLIDPLCVSALNTPAVEASGEVFLRVLRDAMFGARGGSNLLLPRVDLGALFPLPAARWLNGRGAPVRTGRRVRKISQQAAGWRIDDEDFDAVVIAAPAWEAARLVADLPAGAAWAARAQALRHEAIATVYAQADSGLPAPMLALHSGADAPAQFVFDRGRLGGPAGLLVFVVSASRLERDALERQVLAQARTQLAPLGIAQLRPLQTVVEKRATFACTPGLARPPVRIAPGLVACGDHVEGPYPATLEGAVRSAQQAVQALDAAPAGPAGSPARRTLGAPHGHPAA